MSRKESSNSVQIDELWSYVGQRCQKRWIVYAYALETDEI
ncbi:MAG: IS1 family transposase [Raineya sp.]|nr:IS1 family transposase [Raineya sp.]